jgi:16S rRNA (adenine1518-N6/adenine1519-N6)-dimethyltransferase
MTFMKNYFNKLKNLNFNKKLGQNFLIDQNILETCKKLGEIKDNDYIIEIGSGIGNLTLKLLQSKAKKIWTIEIDKKYKKFLKNIKKKFPRKLNFIIENALNYPLANFEKSYKYRKRDYKIISNLPYNISMPWITKLLNQKTKNIPKLIIIILQKEFFKKIFSKNKSKNFFPISIFIQYSYILSSWKKINSNCFFPTPNVSSVLIQLKRKSNPFLFNKKTKEFIRNLFFYRRKKVNTILNANFFREKFQYSFDQLKKINEILSGKCNRPEEVNLFCWEQLEYFFRKNLIQF